MKTFFKEIEVRGVKKTTPTNLTFALVIMAVLAPLILVAVGSL